MRQTSIIGISLIKKFEGERLTAYPDPATGGDPWTIGVGHTGPEVHQGMFITAQQSIDYLRADLVRFEKAVAAMVTVPINQNQWDALISICFNIGPGNLQKSTLIRKLNARDYKGAAAQFGVWNRAAGRVMAGLTTRRRAEAILFRTP